MAHWLTAADRDALAIYWPDSEGIEDDAVLQVYLTTARIACLAYAPDAPPETFEVVTLDLTVPPDDGTATALDLTLTREGRVVTGVIRWEDVADANTYGTWEGIIPEAFRPTLSTNVGMGSVYVRVDPGGDFYFDRYPGAPATVTVEWVAADADETEIPDSWMLAQAMQARNTYNAAAIDPTGSLDASGYGLTAFPLDWQVKQLIRPQRAMGAIW